MNAKAQALTPAAINRALDRINRNPAGRDAGMFTNLDAPKNARTRYFKHATDSWALDNGFPYRLISSVTADGIGAPIQFLKTRAIVAVDESESGTPITETWKISGLKFFDSRSANPARKTRAVRVVAANPVVKFKTDARAADQNTNIVKAKHGHAFKEIARFRDFNEAKAWGQKYSDNNNVQVKIFGNFGEKYK